MTPSEPHEHEWEQGFEGHERAQRRRAAGWSLARKLEWLEEAQVRVRVIRAGRAPTDSPPTGNREDG